MIGLLWFDDDPKRSLGQKVENAARRYIEKFGHPPNVCYVHPSMLNGLADNGTSAISLDIGGFQLRVKPRRSILRHHFWLVCEEDCSP
ncbi:hypothetical protein [Thermogutta sp.]|jgi:hypothetical protein|uniref:hypothetical protein n=1 Tax=Thermogutta sp. TaxID=1962930 RepID=UPI00321FCBC5